MSIAALIRKMAEAGAPPEAIALAVEAIEASQSKDAERRAKQAERKRRSRDSHGTVTGQSRDMDVTPLSLEQKSPTPQKTQTLSPKENPPKGGQKKGSRLPDDWQVSESLSAYAAQQGITGDWLAREAEKFRNWAHATPGAKAVKLNWDRAFQNWLMNAAEKGPPKMPATGPPNGQITEDEKARFLAEWREKQRHARQSAHTH